MSNQRKLEK